MNGLLEALPILHAGHPIWYKGQLAGVAANGEVYAVGWAEPADRLVLRALAVAAFEAPSLDPDQQLSFAAYYLLPDDIWCDIERWPDELIARTVGVPIDVVRRRRALPPLGLKNADTTDAKVCA
jgi:hypothetical protein